MHTIEQIEYIVATNVVNTYTHTERDSDVCIPYAAYGTLGTAHPQYGYNVNWMLARSR